MIRMKHFALALVAALVAVVGLLPVAPVARAEEFTCRGTVGAITLDNIAVPDGATCTLQGTRAKGTIKVGTNATLRASGVQVNGNVQAEGAKLVVVNSSSSVGGSIQIKQGQAATIANVRITGDLQFDANTKQLVARSNRIGGNLQAFKNTGGLTIENNRIAQNLQCKENKPVPTGGGNTASSKEDQCAKL